jgi:TPR repeat protein
LRRKLVRSAQAHVRRATSGAFDAVWRLVGRSSPRHPSALPARYDDRAVRGAFRVPALYNLAHNATDHPQLSKDPAAVTALFRKACTLEYGHGCRRLAERYEQGEGVAPDADEARKYYQRACSFGLKESCDK